MNELGEIRTFSDKEWPGIAISAVIAFRSLHSRWPSCILVSKPFCGDAEKVTINVRAGLFGSKSIPLAVDESLSRNEFRIGSLSRHTESMRFINTNGISTMNRERAATANEYHEPQNWTGDYENGPKVPQPRLPEELTMASGKASSSRIPRLELIPTEALVRLATRFEVGIERKKELAWNALSGNQEILVDKDFILARIGHVVFHAQKLRDAILAGNLDGDDDSAAIAWAGAFLCCATKALKEKK